MRLKPLTAAIAAGTALGFAAFGALAQQPPSNPIVFAPQGVGNGITVQTFDWDVSNALVQKGACSTNPQFTNCRPDGFPIPAPGDDPRPTALDILIHGVLQNLQDSGGNPISVPGLNTAFELTFVGGACVKATPVGTVTTNGQTGAQGLVFALGLNPLDPNEPCTAEKLFFEVWYDDLSDGNGAKSDKLSGAGYRDGKLIMKGSVIDLTGTAGAVPDPLTGQLIVLFDQFTGDNYGGKLTVASQGSQSSTVQVGGLDTAFFKSGVDLGTLAPFTIQSRLPFRQTNPSQMFYAAGTTADIGDVTTIAPETAPQLGAINGLSGPDFQAQTDPSNVFSFIPPPLACRVTGGGNDTSGLTASLDGWDGSRASDQLKPSVLLKPKRKLVGTAQVTDFYEYSFGGQAGANTAQLPQPKGQWEHNNHSSPTGMSFAFHGGKNAPAGTQIDEIRCSDPGNCLPARPAPNKQIDFVGIGTFSNISNNTFPNSDGVIFDGIQNVIPEPKGKRPNEPTPTYHWFQVHIEDLGEPGSQENEEGANCPPGGSGNNPFADPPVVDNVADCGCADFYRITIYKGVQPAVDANGDVILDANGDIPGIDKEHKIYEVYGYIDGGNFQIHPPTGFDLH